MEKKEVPPNTSRIAEGFRDTGYSFDAAIADLIDNSIEAGASVISIDVSLDGDQRPLVTISDNGCGMDAAQLENAMRYGSDPKEDVRRLGRFGLGLKTASTSFCTQLKVVTKQRSSDQIVAAIWDLDELKREGKWLLSIGQAGHGEHALFAEYMAPIMESPETECSGTVVAWREVDRLLKKKQGTLKDPRAALDRIVSNLQLHLGMTFQRFLDPGDPRARNLSLLLNGKKVLHWDPFCEAFGVRPEETMRITAMHDSGGYEEEILVRAFMLPKPNDLLAQGYKEAARLSGTERQGFFVYRENRLVQPASWMELGVIETHLRALRIEISFSAVFDQFFDVGLKKSGLKLDPGLIEQLQPSVTRWRREANERDRKGKARDEAAKSSSGVSPSNHVIAGHLETLQAPSTESSEDGSLTMTNNLPSSPVTVLNSGGSENSRFRVKVVDGNNQVYVRLADALDQGNLWEPAIRRDADDRYQVLLNVNHEWLKRAYLPLSETNPTRQAIDFLMFALAMAELNNTDEDLRDEFEQFRIEVSRNLEKLSVDLPEHDPD